MNIFNKLATIDRRIIFLLIGIVVIIPLILKLRMPVRISQEVRSAYETLEDLPAGSVVLASIDYDATSAPELTPMFRAFLRQCFRNKLKVIYTGHLAIGLPLLAAWMAVLRGQFDLGNAPHIFAERQLEFAGEVLKQKSLFSAQKRRIHQHTHRHVGG